MRPTIGRAKWLRGFPAPADPPRLQGMSAPVEILAIAAHRDDVELTCGGALIKHAWRGQRTGIIDLTAGEMGTRGSA